jgi:hypothetical protein
LAGERRGVSWRRGGGYGVGSVRLLHGPVYHMPAGQSDALDGDWSHGRLIGMSVSLTREPYVGGHFLPRERSDDPILCDVHNTALGDAIVFRLSDRLVHRVSDVKGPVTSFAGWFRSVPRFSDDFRSRGRRPTPGADPIRRRPAVCRTAA